MSPRLPYAIPVVEIFSLELLLAVISYWAELHLESFQASIMELPHKK